MAIDILLFVCVCVWVSDSAEKLPESSSVRVPKIRTIFGVVGVLKLLAGDIALFKSTQTFMLYIFYD